MPLTIILQKEVTCFQLIFVPIRAEGMSLLPTYGQHLPKHFFVVVFRIFLQKLPTLGSVVLLAMFAWRSDLYLEWQVGSLKLSGGEDVRSKLRS